MLDYETLRVIWWVLVGILLIGFSITDGFDLGVGALLTLAGKTDNDRRIMINTIGPHWDGNQVWFITAGGAIFAAFPVIYATAFSGFYLALGLTLLALWMRPIGFDYRSKLTNPTWRKAWDWALFAGGIVPSLIFGVAFGNLLLGVPFEFDSMLKATYTGSFFALLNPFAVLAGLVSVAMLLLHGSVWLQLKTDGIVRARATGLSLALGMITATLFILAGLWVTFGIDGYQITSLVNGSAPSDPTLKTVATETGAWINNYRQWPLFTLAPLIGIAAPILTAILSLRGRSGWAFVTSSLTLAGIITTAGLSMFPFMMPSSSNPSMSLTLWDASSSHLTLNVMFYVALIFVPIVLGYTAWSFWVMRGRVLERDVVSGQSHTIY
jgi:cytochrome bd ubiquinol oxidase subunit II